MTITLIDQATHDRLLEIYNTYPALSLQNNGYQYIDQSKFTEEEAAAFKEVEDILKVHINDFRKLHNFRLSKRTNEIQLRFEYVWDPEATHFVGVGYILLDELLNGFRPSPFNKDI